MINTNNKRYELYRDRGRELFVDISKWSDSNLAVQDGNLKFELRAIVQNIDFMRKEHLDTYIESLDKMKDIDTREIEIMACEFFDEFLDVIEDQVEVE